MAEFRPILLATLPVLKAAFQNQLGEILFESVPSMDDAGYFHLKLRSSYDTGAGWSRGAYDRAELRAKGGSFAPLVKSSRGLAKRLSALMDEALVPVDPGLLAAWATAGRTFGAAMIGEIELELGRDWEPSDFIPTVVRMHPDSPFRYFL